MHIFKGFKDQSDTYHDTRTHYLMEQDPSLLQDQAEVMDVVVADKVEALKEEKMGPPGLCSSRSSSRYSMSRTSGPRDIISLVIPKVGDNTMEWRVFNFTLLLSGCTTQLHVVGNFYNMLSPYKLIMCLV
jgi:hypothetical protein